MSEDKFLKDTKTVLEFIQLYCTDKHDTIKEEGQLELVYEGEKLGSIYFSLCKECKETFLYSYHRLQECPNDPKPRCRKCKNPCYEKSKWRSLANIMRYSGMKKGLVKVKGLFKKNKNSE